MNSTEYHHNFMLFECARESSERQISESLECEKKKSWRWRWEKEEELSSPATARTIIESHLECIKIIIYVHSNIFLSAEARESVLCWERLCMHWVAEDDFWGDWSKLQGFVEYFQILALSKFFNFNSVQFLTDCKLIPNQFQFTLFTWGFDEIVDLIFVFFLTPSV